MRGYSSGPALFFLFPCKKSLIMPCWESVAACQQPTYLSASEHCCFFSFFSLFLFSLFFYLSSLSARFLEAGGRVGKFKPSSTLRLCALKVNPSPAPAAKGFL